MNLPFDAIEGFPLKIEAYIRKPNETEQKVFEYRLQSYGLLDQYNFKIDTAGMKMMPAPF